MVRYGLIDQCEIDQAGEYCPPAPRVKPEKVDRAFLDVDAMARWLPSNGYTCKVDPLDAKVGGTYKMSFRNFGSGKKLLLQRQVSCARRL